MLAELGHFCLILALCLAMLQAIAFVLSKNQMVRQSAIIRPLALGQIFFVTLSAIILALVLSLDDFSVQYVARNSNSALPWYYKLTAFWAAHEGSLLLWVMILCLWMLGVVIKSKNWPLDFGNKVLAVMGLVNIGFLLLLLKSSNPFLRFMLDIPLDGADLNPLLQDIGMITHPPILYMGYVGSVVAFAFAIAALLEGKLDLYWARLVRPWVLSAWIFLTLGITLGSWWAYYELGWGGWWFWDPVENASFMPWLTGTALLHCLAIAKTNGRFLRLALFLAISTFALSLLGTFIVRSGVISSVHAFVTDPERGIFILQFLSITIGGALLLYGLRAPMLKLPAPQLLHWFSLDTAILLNNTLLIVAAGTVFLGTLYPLLHDLMFAQKISVGYPYFNAVFVPIMLLMFSVMLPAILPRKKLLLVIIGLSLVFAIIFLSLWFNLVKFNAVLGLTFGVSILVTSILSRKSIAMSIAHIGLAITIIGISLTPAYEIEKDLQLQFGDTVQVANYTVQFNSLQIIEGPNYLGYQGNFIVKRGSSYLATLRPEKRLYLAQELPMTETAISPGLFADIYIALGQQLSTNSWSVRIYYKPFVRWIWLGALCMALGAVVALFKERRCR